MNHMIVALADVSFSDRAGVAGIVTLQGMLTIFGVLAILWGAVELMHFLLHVKDHKKAQEAVSVPVTPAVTDSVDEEESEDDGAIVAAIIAAISAQRAEKGNTAGFRVVSFKRQGRAGAHKR